ncbi:hypothetical protein L4D76_21495 [Photobacterium sagamiensis]|uniref:hypothetical protein n=1 Tax=Photobacterium sagamiensis TaxID=2910241 RepID=UPI003D0A8B85
MIPFINSLLENQGCSIRYNSQRIRKSGANHVYREVAKNLRKYKDRMRHSYATFMKHYQEVDESKTNQTLHEAVSTMQKYFTGREIESDIVILTKDDPILQKTPTGLCASLGCDSESNQYHKEHRLLHQKNDVATQWCSDYLACIWCKHFRTVADPEHVWQLLSYRDYVLADMSASVSNLDQNEEQTEAIETLKARVEQILTQLKNRDVKAVDVGANLQNDKGMHPFWAFAITSFEA